LPCHAAPGQLRKWQTNVSGVLIELGSFYADEIRKLVLTFDIPGVALLGLTAVATLTFTYVEPTGLPQQNVERLGAD